MSYLSKNIIPGQMGKIFATDAREEKDLLKIKNAISKLYGIRDVIVDKEVFPVEIRIRTSAVISTETIENEVKRFGFHAIPKGVFEV